MSGLSWRSVNLLCVAGLSRHRKRTGFHTSCLNEKPTRRKPSRRTNAIEFRVLSEESKRRSTTLLALHTSLSRTARLVYSVQVCLHQTARRVCTVNDQCSLDRPPPVGRRRSLVIKIHVVPYQ